MTHDLNGTITWGTFMGAECNRRIDAYKARFREVFAILKRDLVDNPTAIRNCARDAIFSGEEYNASFPQQFNVTYAEEIMRRLQDNVPTRVSCDDALGGTCTYEGPNEGFSCSTDALNSTLKDLAPRALHEILHRFYAHPTDIRADVIEHDASAMQQVRRCLETKLDGVSPPVPRVPARSTLKGEAALAQVGNEGGSPLPPIACPSDGFMSGFHGRASTSFIEQLGGTCRTPGPVDSDLPALGGSGGSPFRKTCAPGELLIGARGRSGAWLHSLEPLCASTMAIQAGSASPRGLGSVGGTSGLEWERICPPFMAVKETTLRTGDLVDRLEMLCQDVRNPRSVRKTIQQRTGTSSRNQYLETCQSRSVIDKLLVHAGGVIDRLGARCQSVVHVNSTGAVVLSPDGGAHMLPSHGGSGGTVHVDACPADHSMVGLRLFVEGATVAGIEGRCAHTVLWSNGGSTTGTVATPFRGRAVGQEAIRDCPRGELLVGWRVDTDHLVHGVAPICRHFGN